MNTTVEPATKPRPYTARNSPRTVFGRARDYIGQRFVYTVISPRARGLSLGLNINPNKECNFDCPYCEVDRLAPTPEAQLNLDVMAAELESALASIHAGELQQHPRYAQLPSELLRLRHVAISGDGEPTLCPQFREAVETVAHLRAKAGRPFFKIVLITNASRLDEPEVQKGLRLLTRDDEIWAKLDAGTPAYMERVNRTACSLEKILSNILLVARQRPVIIQSLFPALGGCGPEEAEITRYVERLQQLMEAGAQIQLVQIYSATRPTPNSACGHLPLRTLSQIAQAVRSGTGLNAEVF